MCHSLDIGLEGAEALSRWSLCWKGVALGHESCPGIPSAWARKNKRHTKWGRSKIPFLPLIPMLLLSASSAAQTASRLLAGRNGWKHDNQLQRKKGPQSPQRFVWQTNPRLQCKVLSPRPYPTYWPWVAQHVIESNLHGQYVHINYHGLAPCFLKAPMDRGFNLSIPFPRPLINAQIHPNSQKRAKAC